MTPVPQVGSYENPFNTMRFYVTIDNLEIGAFTAIDGLTAHYEVKTYAEGGENGYVHRLPGRLSYGTIKLTRPLALHTTELTDWFLRFAQGKTHGTQNGAITAMNDDLLTVARWEFRDVWPVSYKGPSFAADAGKVATEEFEFAHNGWTESRGKEPR